MAFAIDRDEHGKPVCLYSFPPYDEGRMSRATDEAIKLANEYREHMFLLAIKRGLDLQDAHEYAARCAMEQLCKRDEIAAKAQVKRKLRK